jgi:phage terminase large subunit-like protein
LETAVERPARKPRRKAATTPPERPARSFGKYERLAYERHERDLALCAQPGGHPQGFTFDAKAGDRVIRFVEGYCRHFEGEWAGQPLMLEEWQRFVFRCVFGWKRADGTRRFRVAYQEVPRKNGKSTEAAGVANYLTFGDQEPGAQVYSTATKEDQAKIVWGAARSMVKMSPDLRRYATLRQKAIVCDRLASSYKPLGSDSDTLDGLNPHGHVCDELHAHKDRKMWDVMITAMGARRQPLTFVITTAGLYEPESIGWQQHDHAVKVLDGVVEDEEFFAIIFAADEEDDWSDPATWAKANPNFGVSVKPDYLRQLSRTAAIQPSFLNTFLRLHLNRWTQQRDRWIAIEDWNACDVELTRAGMDEREQSLERASCFGAFDLSTKLDITALVLVFPDTWDLVCRFFVPADTVQEKVRKDRVPYDAWIRDGWLTATPGNVIDYAFIRAEAEALGARYNVREWAFDPWNAYEIATAMQGDGFPMVEVRQGYRSLSEASKKFEELVVSGKWRHGGHPVMRWMVSNVSTREDPNGNITPEKPKRQTGLRIDGVAATVTALSRAIVATPEYSGDWLVGVANIGSAN